jgi:hypothetical protein
MIMMRVVVESIGFNGFVKNLFLRKQKELKK